MSVKRWVSYEHRGYFEGMFEVNDPTIAGREPYEVDPTQYVLASDYDALEAERDAIRSDFDALGAHYREWG